MANAVSVLYQKVGKNHKTTVFKVALSGAYAAPEVVDLNAGDASNPNNTTVNGPNGTPPIPPRVVAAVVKGGVNEGFVPTLVATATAGQYSLYFAFGTTALAGNFSAGDYAIIEVDHAIQGY